MHLQFLKLYTKFRVLIDSEEGQDLIEYGLLVMLIALAAISGEGKVATAVNTIFSKIGISVT
jgi:Flp pilus assembly pilin Flp